MIENIISIIYLIVVIVVCFILFYFWSNDSKKESERMDEILNCIKSINQKLK